MRTTQAGTEHANSWRSVRNDRYLWLSTWRNASEHPSSEAAISMSKTIGPMIGTHKGTKADLTNKEGWEALTLHCGVLGGSPWKHLSGLARHDA